MKKERLKHLEGKRVYPIYRLDKNKVTMLINWIVVLTIVVIILFIAIMGTVEIHERLDEPTDVLTANNLSLDCIEYNQKTVLRYNVTCESCGYFIGDPCREYSTIREKRNCCSGMFCSGYLVSAEPVEVEIDDTCKQYGLFSKG